MVRRRRTISGVPTATEGAGVGRDAYQTREVALMLHDSLVWTGRAVLAGEARRKACRRRVHGDGDVGDTLDHPSTNQVYQEVRKVTANTTGSRRRQGAVGFYLNRSSKSSGGSDVCGHERGRRPGSREDKQMASGDAQEHAGHAHLKQRKRGARNSPEPVAGGRWYRGGLSSNARSLVAK